MTAVEMFEAARVTADPPIWPTPPGRHSATVLGRDRSRVVVEPHGARAPRQVSLRSLGSQGATEVGPATLWTPAGGAVHPMAVIRTRDGALEIRTEGSTARFSTRVDGVPVVGVRSAVGLIRDLKAGGVLEIVDPSTGVIGRIRGPLSQDAFPDLDRELELLDQLVAIEHHFGVALAVPSTPQQLEDVEHAYQVATTGRWRAVHGRLTVPCGRDLLRRLADAIEADPGGALSLRFVLPRELALPGARVELGPVTATVERALFTQSPAELRTIAAGLGSDQAFDLELRSGAADGVVIFEYVNHLPLEELQERHARLSDKEIAGSLSEREAQELTEVRDALEGHLVPEAARQAVAEPIESDTVRNARLLLDRARAQLGS